VSPNLSDEGEVWKLVTERIATLEELETTWSFDDMIRAHTTLAIAEKIDTIYTEERNKK
jgi:hypothetical protein